MDQHRGLRELCFDEFVDEVPALYAAATTLQEALLEEDMDEAELYFVDVQELYKGSSISKEFRVKIVLLRQYYQALVKNNERARRVVEAHERSLPPCPLEGAGATSASPPPPDPDGSLQSGRGASGVPPAAAAESPDTVPARTAAEGEATAPGASAPSSTLGRAEGSAGPLSVASSQAVALARAAEEAAGAHGLTAAADSEIAAHVA
eukprot:CAMPEP_0119148632 /NCGR_PEP_ID=MMETSP1310-20130426/42144_1 /TAXON_ID=464262 /ORGANISM="Genus nov. species nov., Strain RCC2339" /LENGTH=206 /DNA_ID=CAMNT_0007140681 /DNA_START=153 /DNA_END=769 /DNA_ORIENTATION=+